MGRQYDVNPEIEEFVRIRNSRMEHIGQIGQVGYSERAKGQAKGLKSKDLCDAFLSWYST